MRTSTRLLIAAGIALYATHAHAAECELTQADAMVHLNKAAKELPATVTVLDGAQASDFITTANALQSAQVFVGDTIAVIGQGGHRSGDDLQGGVPDLSEP